MLIPEVNPPKGLEDPNVRVSRKLLHNRLSGGPTLRNVYATRRPGSLASSVSREQRGKLAVKVD
jgi:hypothetical protein